MAKENGVKIEKGDLAKALDTALADLQKAAKGDDLTKSEKKDDDETEDLVDNPEGKGEGTGKKGKDADWKGKAGKGDGDEKESGKGSAETDDSKGGEDADEQAKRDGYRKGVENGLTKSDAVKNAVEVSKFLSEFVKSMAEIMGDLKNSNSALTKRIASLEKSNAAFADALVKSFAASNDITKSLSEEIGAFGGRPMARKSIPSTVKVEVIEKSQRGNEEGGQRSELSKSEIAGKLADLEMKNAVPLGTTSRYEAAGLLSKSVEEMVFGKSAE
jgi:hypothetical protein